MTEKKSKLLGVNYSTAVGRLRKAIMFDLVKQLGRDSCYRCGKKIETLREFSIEHIQPWQSAADPKDAFHNLENISFSHLACNVSHGNSFIKHRPGNTTTIRKFKRLTDDQAKTVKARLNDGDTMVAIAKDYGVHRKIIWEIKQGNTYKHV